MKNINWIVPSGQCFNLSDELFMIEPIDLQKIVAMGPVINRFMFAMQAIVHTMLNPQLKLSHSWQLVRESLLIELSVEHKKIAGIYPQRNSLLTRIDFMIDDTGELKIAEIDPMNKHGVGFALLCRNESGHGERQKILSLFSEILDGYENLSIIITRKDEFFQKEQAYFARKLGEHAGKSVDILAEKDDGGIIRRIENPACCFLDCPVLAGCHLNQKLLDLFTNTPKRFLVPPKHWMANKALMAFLHEPALFEILRSFLSEGDIMMLRQHIPPTFTTNPDLAGFVVKKVLSSGARGVFFSGNAPDKQVVYQQYVPQKRFLLDAKPQHIRLAAHFIGARLGELTVTSSNQVPVHGNSESINYHVVLKS